MQTNTAKLLAAGTVIALAVAAYFWPRDYVGPSDTLDFAMADRVEYSNGGLIAETVQHLDLAAAAGHRQVIDGECLSSCTLVLRYPHVCWTADARFRFHGATKGFEGMLELYSKYPDKLVEIIPMNLTPNDWITITGEQMAVILGRGLCEQ